MTPERSDAVPREFKPGLENVVAGVIIGLLLIAGGCFLLYLPINGVIENGGIMPFWTEKDQRGWCWGAVVGIAVIGVGLIGGGTLLLRGMRSLRTFRVTIGEKGLSVAHKSEVRFVGWDDIVLVQEKHLYERPPILKSPAKYLLPKMLSLHLKQGESVRFDGNAIKGHVKLANAIKAETDRRDVPWELIEEHQDWF